MNEIDLFLKALKGYVSGEEGLESVLEKFKSLDKFHNFGHYLADSDIREKDKEYAEMQNQELEKFISALEAKDYVLAQKISFLGESGV